MKIKLMTAIAALACSIAAAQTVPNVMPSNWEKMQRHAATEHAYFANGGWRERERGNNDAAAGVALLGIIVGVVAERNAELRREEIQREREFAAEQYRQRIESSPMSTVQRTYIKQCFIRQGYDQYGRLYRERVCL